MKKKHKPSVKKPTVIKHDLHKHSKKHSHDHKHDNVHDHAHDKHCHDHSHDHNHDHNHAHNCFGFKNMMSDEKVLGNMKSIATCSKACIKSVSYMYNFTSKMSLLYLNIFGKLSNQTFNMLNRIGR